MLVLDAKTTFFDDDGKPLSGGRLRYFAFGTTTPISVYADSDYVTPLGSVVALTSAGWTSTGIYANQSVTVHSDRYIGLDEFGAEQYEEVKNYDYITSASGGSGSDSSVVDTIDDLRDVTPSAGLAVTVKGYYTALDCFPRTYIWDTDSSALDNLGTVIESSVVPTGRWLLGIEGPYVDCRIFGVMPGLQTTNSAFAQHFSYCSTYKKTAYFVTGQYYLTSGGSISVACAIKADKDVKVKSNSGTYTFTVTNPNLDIANTFAGTGLKLILNGNGWQNTIVPMTAWNATTKGYADGNAYFNLKLNNGLATYTWDNQATYRDIILDEGINYVNTASYAPTAYELRGVGRLNYSDSTTMHFSKIRTSLLNNHAADQMERTYELIVLDSSVELSSFSTSAHIHAEGAGAITTQGSVVCSGGISGSKKFFIAGSYGINLGEHPIEAENWADGIGLVQTYNLSSTAFLDMKGYVTTGIVTKGGRIKNGVIYRVTNAATWLDLENVTVNGDVESASITAKGCSFIYAAGNVFPYMTSSNISNCSITTGAAINATNSVWNEVNVTGDLKCIGGSARWKEVFCVNALFIPNDSKLFGNFSWVGGSAAAISFDASQMTNTGEAICYNTKVQNLLYLTGNISSVNGSTKKWARNGHYNVAIGDNEGAATRRTYGTCDTTVATAYKAEGLLNTSRVFYFNKTGTDSVTSGRLIACSSLVAARPWFGGANLYTGEAGGPFQGAIIRFGSKGSYPGVGDACSMTFEVYK